MQMLIKHKQATITPAVATSGEVIVMEYGARVDKDCIEAAQKQIVLARRLYNDVVASIRQIVGDMNHFVMSKAGQEAIDMQTRIDLLTQSFNEAKARDDEDVMKQIAQQRRECWRELGALLKGVRKAYKAEIQSQYLARIGRNTSCDTYRVRCDAVAAGLGWATANSMLDNALLAFKKSFALGRPPRFAVGSEKDQDTLTLQFTAAGGVAANTLLSGKHAELSIMPTQGCGRRKYGEFRFRLGAAKDDSYATGTWQYHRPIPEDASIGLARLIRRRIGKDYKWAVQLQVKPKAPVREVVGQRSPLVAVHMGWAQDINGRRIAGIADSPDPGAAQVIQLPPQIEEELERAATIQGERDTERDTMVPKIKAITLPDDAPETITSVMASIKPLSPRYVSANRIHYLCQILRDAGLLPDWLEEWRKADRLRWQAHTHIARRARNTRRNFYRNLAINLGRRYDAIVIEPLDLAGAAKKVDEKTGEKVEFGRKARSGRVVAALYELESAIRWAAAKTDSAVLELVAKTACTCSICGGNLQNDPENNQELHCDDCGALLDRKQNGAAIAYQAASEHREDAVSQYWLQAKDRKEEQRAQKEERLDKMSRGRRDARTKSDGDLPGGSRSNELNELEEQ